MYFLTLPVSGVLQEEVMTKVLEGLKSELTGCAYDSDHFNLALSIPVSLALRSHSLNLYIKNVWKVQFCINLTRILVWSFV